MLPTFYRDRVFDSFVIDVFFVWGWTAQDLTMDSTSPPFLLMDQAWIFDQTNASTQLGFHQANLKFSFEHYLLISPRKSPSHWACRFVFFFFVFLQEKSFVVFFFDKKKHPKHEKSHLSKLQSSWHRRLLLCPHGCWIMYRSQILRYMRSKRS